MTMSDDLIKRSDAIGAVWGDDINPSEDGMVFEAQSHIDRDIRLIPSADRPQGWIPCSKRLPKEKDAGILKKLGTEKRSEYVLATVEVKGERMTVTACTYDGVWQWDKKYAFPDFKVVAWMPLPEPWKGADDD